MTSKTKRLQIYRLEVVIYRPCADVGVRVIVDDSLQASCTVVTWGFMGACAGPA